MNHRENTKYRYTYKEKIQETSIKPKAGYLGGKTVILINL